MGDCSLSDVRTVAVESWLSTLKKLANGSRAKVRNIMHAIFAHAIRWEFFDRNPITEVRQSVKLRREPEVLTAEELKALLEELEGIFRTMVFVAGTTGLRISEVIGLRWSDCDFETGEIRLKRGIVRQKETELRRKQAVSRYRWKRDCLKSCWVGVDSASTTNPRITSSRLCR